MVLREGLVAASVRMAAIWTEIATIRARNVAIPVGITAIRPRLVAMSAGFVTRPAGIPLVGVRASKIGMVELPIMVSTMRRTSLFRTAFWSEFFWPRF